MNTEDLCEEINEAILGEASPMAKNEVRKTAKALQKQCEELQIPMIFVMCTKKEGYQIKCLLPDEFVDKGELGNHPNRFPELLRVAKGFDKESYKVQTMKDNN